MLYRYIEHKIAQHLRSNSDKILVVTGARQVGKSYIIRHTCKQLFANYIEINFIDDFNGNKLFENVKNVDEFFLVLSSVAGNKLGTKSDSIIFFDEIQQYPQFLTMLKFLREDGRANFIASGSLLGISLKRTVSIPVGSIEIIRMFPLNFEEFLIANNVGEEIISAMRKSFEELTSLPDGVHTRLLDLFKRYLIVGGMPDAVNTYLDTHNIIEVRNVQRAIFELYGIDASQYDQEHRLKIKKIYEMIPSNMENIKKRLVFNNIDATKGRSSKYTEEMDYLAASGIALDVTAVSNPKFPLTESIKKNLIKLYLNDVGILTGQLYHNNIMPILNNEESVNLGSVYETAVAMELASHGNRLHYYDNKTNGEVDFIVDDFNSLSVVPIEVKSGKNYKTHRSLTRFVSVEDYHIDKGYVLSNSGEIISDGKIIYLPIYYSMFFNPDATPTQLYF